MPNLSHKSAVEATYQEADGLVYPPYAEVFTYAYGDADSSNNIYKPVPAGRMITRVIHRVTTAFAGGSPSITVGDSDSDTTFLISADITEATLNNVADSLTATTPVGAKYYASADYVKISLSASLTAGAGQVTVFYNGIGA